MLRRIRVDLAFQSEDPALDILDKALDHFPEAKTINPGQPNEEHGFIVLEDCHHNDGVPNPCIVKQRYVTP